MDTTADNRRPPPTWIDRSFIEEALKASEEEAPVESVSVEWACQPGAGYGSQMFRAKVTLRKGGGSSEQRSLVIKADHDQGAVSELTEKAGVFATESLVLGEVLPALHEKLRQAERAAFRPLVSRCLHTGRSPLSFLVLEDLAAAGFRLPDPGHPLDYDHCELALRTYARLHASSALLLRERPDYGQRLQLEMFTSSGMDSFLRQMSQSAFCAVAEFMSRTAGYESYASKYERLIDTVYPRLLQALARKVEDTKLPVLVHGDSWKNNMMFKYAEGKVTDLRLVDFQMTNVTSPARDLVFFLYANGNLAVHERLDALLEAYHAQLLASLRSLGGAAAADAYPLGELRRDLDDLAPLALVTATWSGFILTSERDGQKFAEAVRKLEFTENTFRGICDNEYSPAYLKYITRLFEGKGLL